MEIATCQRRAKHPRLGTKWQEVTMLPVRFGIIAIQVAPVQGKGRSLNNAKPTSFVEIAGFFDSGDLGLLPLLRHAKG
jgi:hypothetical protein